MSENIHFKTVVGLYSNVVSTDARTRIRSILESDRRFRQEEVEVAISLFDEWTIRGKESGYHFVFAIPDNCAVVRQGIAGFACIGPIACTVNRWDVHWIAVDRAQRGKGIGSLLLREAEREAAASGAVAMFIDTSGRKDYDSTRRFYEQHGYVKVSSISDFYDRWDDKIVYSKRLLWYDDPEFDCTDYAHPAWWRGEEYGSKRTISRMEMVLDGEDDGHGVISSRELESFRRRLLRLVGKVCERCDRGSHQTTVINGICDDCFDVARDALRRPDPQDEGGAIKPRGDDDTEDAHGFPGDDSDDDGFYHGDVFPGTFHDFDEAFPPDYPIVEDDPHDVL